MSTARVVPLVTRRQSGVIPYRQRGAAVDVLLVTNRGGSRWLVPKGGLEPGLSAQQSAAREALEEAGVQGVLDPVLVGSFSYERNKERRVIDLYPLHVLLQHQRWPEMSDRRRRWVPLECAAGAVNYDGLGACFDALARRLQCCCAA